MKAIDSLLVYVNSKQEDNLIRAIESVCVSTEDITARIVSIKLLGWIRWQNELAVRPMDLPQYPWAICIRECVAQIQQLGWFFVVKENRLCFNSARSVEELEAVVALVKKHYNPKLLNG